MEINKALKVGVVKSFSANLDELYNAWTIPEQLKQWWKPMGNTLLDVINDIKEGGVVRYTFESNNLIISGKYISVMEKEKLVYTWNWIFPDDAIRNGNYKLTVNFISKGNGSEINILQENFQNEETLLPHKQGWEKGLSDLEHFLTNSNTSAQNKEKTDTLNSDGGGYREDPAQVKVGGG